MTFQQAVENAAAKLLSVCVNPKLESQLLLCHSCNIEQTFLFAHPEKTLNEHQLDAFNSVLQRREEGEPLAYITGTKEFWSLGFTVNEHVLIPRPETELLVELTLKKIANIKSPRILDLGTGSGAIAISIATERPDCDIIATDNSFKALEVAQLNAQKHNVDIQYRQSDWYKEFTHEKFNVIVSNPPYIEENDPNLDENVFLHEPQNALISKNNGLYSLSVIISNASHHLAPSGILIIEHGFQQAESVKKLFCDANFNNVISSKDIAGHLRCTSGNI